MSCYTCTTVNRHQSHTSQHLEDNPEQAFREHIKLLPFSDGINPIGDELYWLQNIAYGKCGVTLHSVEERDQTWKWAEGENYSPTYVTRIIKTDAGK